MLRALFKRDNDIERKPAAGDPLQANAALDAQNLDSFVTPTTDAGAVPPFKYPFSFAHKRMYEGGWSHEVTVRELPIATDLAGVLMRLTPGGVRELHWHKAAEWAMVLYGSARIPAIDADGKSFVADVGEGDLWFFPAGIPHSIQGLKPNGTKFLLVFDDGNFSEYETVLLSDWIAHTPRSVLAKNFGVSQGALEKLPEKERFIFQTDVPGSLEEDQRAAAGALGISSCEFAFRVSQPGGIKRTQWGEARIVDSSTFKVSNTVASALVTVKPGGMRELHWHANADEWQYHISGQARMTIFTSGGRARTMDLHAGDVAYVPKPFPHYVQNTGDTELKFLEMFKSDTFMDLSLSEWLTHTPPELVMSHLNIDRQTLEAIPKDSRAVVG